MNKESVRIVIKDYVFDIPVWTIAILIEKIIHDISSIFSTSSTLCILGSHYYCIHLKNSFIPQGLKAYKTHNIYNTRNKMCVQGKRKQQ
jgi:hypothetical protein